MHSFQRLDRCTGWMRQYEAADEDTAVNTGVTAAGISPLKFSKGSKRELPSYSKIKLPKHAVKQEFTRRASTGPENVSLCSDCKEFEKRLHCCKCNFVTCPYKT